MGTLRPYAGPQPVQKTMTLASVMDAMLPSGTCMATTYDVCCVGEGGGQVTGRLRSGCRHRCCYILAWHRMEQSSRTQETLSCLYEQIQLWLYQYDLYGAMIA